MWRGLGGGRVRSMPTTSTHTSISATASQAAVARFDTTAFSYSVSNGALAWSSADRYQRLDTEAQSAGGTLGCLRAAFIFAA